MECMGGGTVDQLNSLWSGVEHQILNFAHFGLLQTVFLDADTQNSRNVFLSVCGESLKTTFNSWLAGLGEFAWAGSGASGWAKLHNGGLPLHASNSQRILSIPAFYLTFLACSFFSGRQNNIIARIADQRHLSNHHHPPNLMKCFSCLSVHKILSSNFLD